MKGQFFIIGAILIITLFAAMIPRAPKKIVSPIKDLTFYSANIKKEMPKALNFGLESGKPKDVMLDFSSFLQNETKKRYINLSLFWLYTNTSGNSINITIGNFMQKELNVTVNISGNVQKTNLNNTKTATLLFSSVPANYTMIIAFNGYEKKVMWIINKINFFVYYELKRGKHVIKDELTA